MTYRASLSKPDAHAACIPDVQFGEHTLHNTEVRRSDQTQALVYAFDVLDRGAQRIGLAHLSVDNTPAAHELGHFSVQLAKDACTPEKLAMIGRELIRMALEAAVSNVRIVVAEHAPSRKACELLGADGQRHQVGQDSESYRGFEYGV